MRVEPGLEPGLEWVFIWLGPGMRIDGFVAITVERSSSCLACLFLFEPSQRPHFTLFRHSLHNGPNEGLDVSKMGSSPVY